MGENATGLEVEYDGLDIILQEEVRGHQIEFWTDLQGFHDEEQYFTQTGFSDFGELRFQELLEAWS